MSKSLGKIGAWAAEAERAEAEERENAVAAAAAAAARESQSFPSLKEAVSAKPKKKKAMTLSELNTGVYVGPGGGKHREFPLEATRLTTEEMLLLPTGPKERAPGEMDTFNRLGGGFRSYGRPTGPPPGRRDEGEGSWGGGGRRSYGGFDEERERRAPPPRVPEFDQPSRADEVDNWASGKRLIPVTESGRNDRYGSLGGGIGGSSRADEVDNWVSTKKPITAARSTTFGSGFRDSALEHDRWSRGGGMGMREERERLRLVLDPPKGDASVNEPARSRPSPFGGARPREEVLAEKGLDWKKLDSENEVRRVSRPTSAHSSRPSSAHSSRPESPATSQVVDVVQKPRQKVNPFGDAKPREVLLQEKGKDWRKIDLELEHRGVDRPETEDERMLKEEIEQLKKDLANQVEVNANGQAAPGPAGESISLHEQLLRRERNLELLIRELDDKVRFGQRASDRPGSGAGRVYGFPERPPSQSGRSEESRNTEFMDRPRSRGAEIWTRSADDRRQFQGSRERGFLNRDPQRSSSRERW